MQSSFTISLPGRVFLWTFRPDSRHARGWHLAADAEGGEFFSQLLDRIAEVPGSITTLQLTAASPADIKAISGSRPASIAPELILNLDRKEEAHWHTEEQEGKLLLTLGVTKLQLLQTALLRIRKGEGDFAIGDERDEHLLNFWAFPEGPRR